MGTVASQTTSLTIVHVYSRADQRKHQSSASLDFERGIHRGPVKSPHKWPVTRKMFPFDDVIMISFISFRFTSLCNHTIVTTPVKQPLIMGEYIMQANYSHIEAQTKWPPFLQTTIRCNFVNDNFWISNEIVQQNNFHVLWDLLCIRDGSRQFSFCRWVHWCTDATCLTHSEVNTTRIIFLSPAEPFSLERADNIQSTVMLGCLI